MGFMKPLKEAYLKHDLFKIITPKSIIQTALTQAQVQRIVEHNMKQTTQSQRVAQKGTRFLYFEECGWVAEGCDDCKMGMVTEKWVEDNLTDPVDLV
jgi:hypothetical protein